MKLLRETLATVAVAAGLLLSPFIPTAGASGSLSICTAENGNSNTCQGGWLFQTSNGDACGASLLYDQRTGTDDAVWIDDEVPSSYSWAGYGNGRASMALCENWGLGRPTDHIYIGCYINTSYPKNCGGSDDGGPVGCCENMAEWYPYHQGLTAKPWAALGSCSNNITGDVNGFITQQHFAWPNDTPPTSGESATEWGYAISCATRYDEPMGTY